MDPIDIATVLFKEGWNEQDFTKLKRLVADEVPLHIGADTRTTNVAELENIVARWHEAFPDLRFEVHSITADDAIAAVRATLHGTHLGPWGDLQATGRSIAVAHAFFLRFEGGLLVEVWELLDKETFNAQLIVYRPI